MSPVGVDRRVVMERVYDKDGVLGVMSEFCKDENRLWLKDISLEFGVSWERFLEDWEGEEWFDNAYECCVQVQESRAVRYGMTGALDRGMVMKILDEKHGWRKKESGGGGVMVVLPDGEWMERLRERVKKRVSG